MDLKNFIEYAAPHLCSLGYDDLLGSYIAFESTRDDSGFSFGRALDDRFAAQGETAALDVAVNGALDRDIAFSFEITGQCRIRAENRVLNLGCPRFEIGTAVNRGR